MKPAPAPIPPRLSTPAQVASAFRGLRWRLAANGLRLLLTGSRLRLAMIAVCSAIFWAGLFFLFFGGFQFLKSFIPNLSGEFVEYIFSMFFLSLLIMLIFSSGIILYTGMFHSREAAYLLTTPAGPDRIFAYKFFEAIAYSSWAFLLLGSPMMVSFGIVEDAFIAGFDRQARFDGFQQVVDAALVRRGDCKRFADAEAHELDQARFLVEAIGLVDDQHDVLRALAQPRENGFVQRRRAGTSIHDEQHDVGFIHARANLLRGQSVHAFFFA